jgi:hypothetical protein
MGKIFLVEWTILENEWNFEIISPENEKINFVVVVTEMTIQSVANAIVQDKELFSVLKWKTIEYTVKKVEQHTIN